MSYNKFKTNNFGYFEIVNRNSVQSKSINGSILKRKKDIAKAHLKNARK